MVTIMTDSNSVRRVARTLWISISCCYTKCLFLFFALISILFLRWSLLRANRRPAGLWERPPRWYQRVLQPCRWGWLSGVFWCLIKTSSSWDIFKPWAASPPSTTPPSYFRCRSTSWNISCRREISRNIKIYIYVGNKLLHLSPPLASPG